MTDSRVFIVKDQGENSNIETVLFVYGKGRFVHKNALFLSNNGVSIANFWLSIADGINQKLAKRSDNSLLSIV